MSANRKLRVVVAGAGAFGSTLALLLARAGAKVTLVDPFDERPNASAVAAGMLAPAFETVLEETPAHLPLLLAARDAWTPLAASLGVDIDRRGAVGVAKSAKLDAWERGLAALGLGWGRLSADQVAECSSWLRPGLAGVWTDEDWRLDAPETLGALLAAGAAVGVERARARVLGLSGSGTDRSVALSDGTRRPAAALVIATGAELDLIAVAPMLASLKPIKGHILRIPGVALPGPTVRLAEGYITGSAGGVLVGATMEPGRRDAEVDMGAVRRLKAMADRASPWFARWPLVARTGVRAATPDGLPMAGPAGEGVWLAVGARRNGWLLAPLVAETVRRSLLGESASPWAALLDPGRFSA